MLSFNLITCALLVATVSTKGILPQFDFFDPNREINKRLESYVEKHGPPEGLEELWLEQKLDHFTPSDTEVFSQRYAMNKQYYGNNSVAFLLISGDVIMIDSFLGYSFMGDEAKKWRAATFMLEHRFYGKSVPKGHLKMDALKYLSSEQALADIANFITQMNTKHGFQNPKWIVFGWNYAGSLAAWMRYRYPHLVYAAVSSSAPLIAKANFSDYFQSVSKSLSTVSTKCVDAIREAYRKMSDGMKNSTKREHYRELFHPCEPLEDNKNDIALFFRTITYSFAFIVEYRGSIWFKDISMESACQIMTDETIHKCPVHRLAVWFNKLYYSSRCWEHRYSAMIEILKNTTARDYGNSRQMAFQSCTEFGWWHHTSSKRDDTFGDRLTLDFFATMCKDAFDSRFNTSFLEDAARDTNMIYGGLSLDVSRELFVHGSMDPWSSIGITKEPPRGSIAVYIKGLGNCADVFPTHVEDSPQIKKVHERMSRILQRWTTGKKQEPEMQSIYHF
ncbi:unnamed protein product [Bemisia tabaci]|uniref:Serine carboxypeptidase S28 n=1 Tax=Bemisia tabaci TaxID=7038 RepID=A0A9P0ABT3_BEMTA|nr:unnamed protein product [Bemisia tabaci]